MKRFFVLLLSIMMLSAAVLPSFATDTFAATEAEEKATVSSTEEQGEAEATTAAAKPTRIEVSENDSSDTKPIGDSFSYYNMEALGSGPDITAESAILMDAETGAILYGKEANTKRYPASITKVMTALLAVENCNMNDIVTFSSEAVNGIEAGSSSAGINVGAKLTVEDTLYALMLVSANEAGAALAEHIGGSTEEFAKMMTERAKELGCTGTHFTNPHGLPDENHYTTAHDIALILKQAMKYDSFRKIASADSYTLKKSDTLTSNLELWNHAKILRENSEYYYKYAEGAKTGFTQAALNTLVTYAKKGDTELLCVILKDYGADNSYYDTKALFQWGFKNVKKISPLQSFDLNAALSQDKSLDSKKLESYMSLNPSFNKDYYILVPVNTDEKSLTTSFTLKENSEKQILGYINISSGDTVIGTTPVTYEKQMTTDDMIDLNEDDLETAPVDKDAFTPRKLLEYIIRIIITIILIVIIMSIIRRFAAEKRRKERIEARKNGSHASVSKKKKKGRHQR